MNNIKKDTDPELLKRGKSGYIIIPRWILKRQFPGKANKRKVLRVFSLLAPAREVKSIKNIIMIKYIQTERTIANGPDKGQVKTYATLYCGGRLTYEELRQRLVDRTRFSQGDILCLMENLHTIITEELTQGKIVETGPLGNFQPMIHSGSASQGEEFTVCHIRKLKIIYRPGKPICEALKNVTYKKVEPRGTL